MVKVSIILPLYNSEIFIKECINSILNQSFKDYELIIIDDCSTDKTKEMLTKLGLKFYINKKNLGFTKTVNKGIKLSKGEYVTIADHDMVYDENYLINMLKEKKDIVSCRMYYYKQKDKIRALNIKINLFTGKTTIIGRDEIDRGQFDEIKGIEAIGAASMLIRRTVLDKIGLFDENFFMFYVDVDFCYRARKAGYKIFPSKAKCWHKKEESYTFKKEQLENYYHDKKMFLKKYSPYYPLCLIPMGIKKIINRGKTENE